MTVALLCPSLVAGAPVLNRPSEIGARIAACWRAPAEGDEVTVRLTSAATVPWSAGRA